MLQMTWPTRSFADLIDKSILQIGDGYRARLEELGGDGPIFLRAGHVTDSHIDFKNVERFRSDLAQVVASKLAAPGDVVVTTKGNSTGRVNDHCLSNVLVGYTLLWEVRHAPTGEPG